MLCYAIGDQGLPYNPGAAFALLRHSASLGDPEAQSNYGLLLASGLYTPALNTTQKGPGQIHFRHGAAMLHFTIERHSNLPSSHVVSIGDILPVPDCLSP